MTRCPFIARPAAHAVFMLAAMASIGFTVSDTAADVVLSAYSGPTSFSYKLNHMPDFDQRRMAAPGIVGLANNGSMYCVPTAMTNVMAYAANHGFPGIQPGPAWWQSPARYNDAGTSIAVLGSLMGTNPNTGTIGAGLAAGTSVWLSGSPLTYTHYYASGSWAPKIEDLAFAAVTDNLVAIAYGRYTMLAPGVPNLIGPRTGGHMVTMVEAQRSGDLITIKVRDPADDPDEAQSNYLTTQSTFSTVGYEQAKNRSFTINFGVTRTMTALSYPVAVGETINCIDSAMCVRPMSAFCWQPGINNNPPMFKFPRPVFFLGFAAASQQTLPLILGQVVVDAVPGSDGSSSLALISQAPPAPVTLRLVDHVTGEQTAMATIPGATDMTLGRKRELYVLSPGRVDCFDVDVRPAEFIAGLVPPGPCAAVCFDDEQDELVVFAPEQRRIYRYREHLPAGVPPETSCIPAAVPLGQDGCVAVNPVDGKVWFATLGHNSIYHVPDGAACDAGVEIISLPQIIAPHSLSFDDRGHLFVMAADGLFELQVNAAGGWALVAKSYFGDMVAPNSRGFNVTRSRTNFDAAMHDGPAFHNIDPSELEDEELLELDCVADINGDGTVDINDLLAVISSWGPCNICLTDTNDDRVIDVDDLLIVIAAWGPCP